MDAINDPVRNLIARRAVVIPGAQKSGTESLFAALARHPRIVAARLKEPQFLAFERKTVAAHLAWYGQLFPDTSGGVLFEASTAYLASRRAVDNVAEFLREPRILVVLRDPARRACSAWWHMHSRLPSADSRPLDQILSELERPGDPLEHEARALDHAAGSGAVDAHYLGRRYLARRHSAPFHSDFEDPLWSYRYLAMSRYRGMVERWERAFPGRVRVVFFEDLLGEPRATLEGVLRFLELEAAEPVLAFPHLNAAAAPRRRRAELLACPGWLKLIPAAIWKRSARERLSTTLRAAARPPRVPYESGHCARLRALLAPEYEYWFAREPRLRELWSGVPRPRGTPAPREHTAPAR